MKLSSGRFVMAVFAAGALPLAAAAAATPPIAFLPTGPGAATYRYEVDENGPAGSRKVRASLALTRVGADRVQIVMTPDAGSPTTLVAALDADGTLRPVQQEARASAAGMPPTTAGGRPGGAPAPAAGDPSIPLDGPILGLPGGGRPSRGGNGGNGSGYPGGGNTGSGYPPSGSGYPGGGNGSGYPRGDGTNGGPGVYGAGLRPAIPHELQIVAALSAARAAQNASTFSFNALADDGKRRGTYEGSRGSQNAPYDAQAGAANAPQRPAGLAMTARVTPGRSGEVQVVADGSGQVQIANGGAGRRSGGSGRRGPAGGGGLGSILFPGGGGRAPQGGDGAGRRAGGGGFAPVPATMTVHVDSTFRNNVLEIARGKTTTTYARNGSDVTTTSTWLLSAY